PEIFLLAHVFVCSVGNSHLGFFCSLILFIGSVKALLHVFVSTLVDLTVIVASIDLGLQLRDCLPPLQVFLLLPSLVQLNLALVLLFGSKGRLPPTVDLGAAVKSLLPTDEFVFVL